MTAHINMKNYKGHRTPGNDYSVALRDLLPDMITKTSMTCLDIATKTGRTHSTVITVIKKLKRDGRVFVARWQKRAGIPGPMEACYQWGNNEDAEKPEPDTDAVKCQRYRDKHRGIHHRQIIQADPLMRALYGRG